MALYYVYFVCLALINHFSVAERLNEQIYSSIEGGAACFRRLNGTHQTGCSSSNNGAVGAVLMVENVTDVQWLVHNSSAGPYIAVVSTFRFHDVVELLMENPDNVAGVLLYDNATEKAIAFSQESRCPNEYSSGPGSQCSSSQAGGFVWNDAGTGLLRRNVPFPMFYLPQSRAEEIVKIRKCYEKYNLDRDNQKGQPLCSLQLNSFMYAAVNSAVCTRRSASSALLTPTKVCDPLGDHNVYYSLFPRAKETNVTKKSVTLVTARIDTASLFDGVSPGAASSAIGMVTLITTATVLSKMIPISDAPKYDHNILWTLFNGEAFDYIGSQRVAYDLSRGAWPAKPLSPSDIKLHVEIGQIGGALASTSNDSTWPFYAYAPYTNIPSKVIEFLAAISSNMNLFNMTIAPVLTTNIPPSSLHSFRRILKNETENEELIELLLVDYKDTFENKFYHSVLDDYDAVRFNYHNISIDANGTFISTDALLQNGTMQESEMQVKIAKFSTALARTLYQEVTGTPYADILEASAHMVDELLYCFLRSQVCRLLLAADYAASPEDSIMDKPTPLYVGVAAWASPPPVFAGHLLALLTGNHLDLNRTGCDSLNDPDYAHYWLRGWNLKGVCIQTTMNFSQAVSPAFIVQDYDMASGLYSTWTESVWQTMWARVFVRGGGAGARGAALAGAAATLLAAGLAVWMKRHTALLPGEPARLQYRDYGSTWMEPRPMGSCNLSIVESRFRRISSLDIPIVNYCMDEENSVSLNPFNQLLMFN